MAPPGRFPHAMMIAPTGRGKGVGFVIPNLLHFSGSAIILDVKGENFAKTSSIASTGSRTVSGTSRPSTKDQGRTASTPSHGSPPCPPPSVSTPR